MAGLDLSGVAPAIVVALGSGVAWMVRQRVASRKDKQALPIEEAKQLVAEHDSNVSNAGRVAASAVKTLESVSQEYERVLGENVDLRKRVDSLERASADKDKQIKAQGERLSTQAQQIKDMGSEIADLNAKWAALNDQVKPPA